MPNEVKVPKFDYPFKRNTKNSAKKRRVPKSFMKRYCLKIIMDNTSLIVVDYFMEVYTYMKIDFHLMIFIQRVYEL